MKIFKKSILTLLAMIIVIYSLIPPKPLRAEVNYTREQTQAVKAVGRVIAKTAENFFENHASETIYDYVINNGHREAAYQNKKTEEGIATNLSMETMRFTDKYPVDCVGFVSMIVHCATGLGDSTFTIFAQPTNGIGDGRNYQTATLFDSFPASELQKGDIICRPDHVAIAIGDGMMIDSAAIGNEGGEEWTITRREIWYEEGSYVVVRVTPEVAQELVKGGALRTTWYGGSLDNPIKPIDPDNPDDPNDPDNPNTPNSGVNHTYKYISNSTEYYYNGMPVTGEYLGHTDDNWLITAFVNILDWLVGLLTMGYKIQVVGWATIIQNLAINVVNSIVSTNIEEKITAESIIFNEVQILDINFFDMENAGGNPITQDNVVYMLRSRISSLYYSIRSIAIIVMLVILIYVGIRMALSTVAGDKVKYKQMFWSWCVGFIIIMFIHYFMLVVININNQVINAMNVEAINSAGFYDEVRSYAYEIPASKGWTGALMYVFLIYYMIKLLIFYFKRVLVVYILAIISPIIGISYSIEMIKGKSKSFSTWMKDFSFNVLIQSLHVIIYGIFMNIIYSYMQTINIVNMIPYIVVMILIINFMLKSEKLIKTIFGLKSSTVKDVKDSAIQMSSTFYTAMALTAPIKDAVVNKIKKSYSNSVDNRINNKYEHLENPKEDVEKSKLATDIQRQIDRLKAEEANRIKKFDKNSVDLVGNVLHGIGGVVSSAPMAFEAGPIEGGIHLINSSINMNSSFGGIGSVNIDPERIEELAEKYGVTIQNSNNTQRGITGSTSQNSQIRQGNNNQTSQNGSNGQRTNTVYTTVDRSKNKKIPTQDQVLEPNSGRADVNTNESKANGTNPNPTVNERRALNYKRANKHRGLRIAGAMGHLATAGTTGRVTNIIASASYESEKINNPYVTAQIEILYKIQAEVLKQEQLLNEALENLQNSGFPPVFYEPQPGESEASIATNEMLRDRFRSELLINLEQAIGGEPSVTQDQVNEAVEVYTMINAINTIQYADLAGVLSEVASQNGYDIGEEFDDNLRETVAEDLLNIAQNNKKDAHFNKNIVSKEVLEKVEQILQNNDWDEEKSVNDVKTIITNNLEQEIVSKLSADQLNSILTTAINKKQSLRKKPVSPEFEPIVQATAKVAEMKTEMAELSGEKFDAQELIEDILNENAINLDNIQNIEI